VFRAPSIIYDRLIARIWMDRAVRLHASHLTTTLFSITDISVEPLSVSLGQGYAYDGGARRLRIVMSDHSIEQHREAR